MVTLCMKCSVEKTEEDRNYYNRICGVLFGVCGKCWDGKFDYSKQGSKK